MNVAGEAVGTRHTHLRVLTNSEISAFRRCARYHHYAYRVLRRPVQTSEALRFGTLIHKALEAWWLAKGTPDERLSDAIDAIDSSDSDPYEQAKAVALMTGYTARWGYEAIETLSVETEFRTKLLNPTTGGESRTYQLGGKLDVIARLGARMVLVEHKTTSEDLGVGAHYWKRVSALDSQVSQYLSGAKAAGYPVEECIYDVIRKPGLRPLKATPLESRKYKQGTRTLYANQREEDEPPSEYCDRILADIEARPDRYFARGEIVRLEGDATEHALDVWHTARTMRESELAKRYPRNPDSCVRYGSTCAYFPVCSGEASITDDTLFRTAETAHEELSEIPS